MKESISETFCKTMTTWEKIIGSLPPIIFWHSTTLSRAVIWCGMFFGKVMSMCCTVASLLYFNGQTTRILNIGGCKVPPGDIILIAEGTSTLDKLVAELTVSVRPWRGPVGMASVIGDGELSEGSGTYDEADDRSDLTLLERLVRIEGSELPEEASGDPPASEDVS